MDFRGAWQPFGGGHQAKACPVIAVQSAFRSGPDVTGAVLRQRQDGQVLQPLGRSVVAETVLLGRSAAGERQNEQSTGGEAIVQAHHGILHNTYRPEMGRSLQFSPGVFSPPAARAALPSARTR